MENDIAVTSRMPFGDGITTVTSPATNKQGQRVGYCSIGYNRSMNGKRLACADWYMVTNATGKMCENGDSKLYRSGSGYELGREEEWAISDMGRDFGVLDLFTCLLQNLIGYFPRNQGNPRMSWAEKSESIAIFCISTSIYLDSGSVH
ncbi:uncharacterized protein RAG0_13943 [Rhynchosporium agropyri]|uniref:Uncharacterized protein n=1 Tax=Rhynchosporium agropyri TaxID=914238 RepID=A0A1E1LEX7_9HELO|nr:uncharacterized protein RAG0_13943 [Rhynchosporium agropyri]